VRWGEWRGYDIWYKPDTHSRKHRLRQTVINTNNDKR
jgi:hypothetical protein